MSALWLFPASMIVISICVLAALVAYVAAEATRLNESLRRLERLAVATDELSRATSHTKRSVAAVARSAASRRGDPSGHLFGQQDTSL